MIRTSGKYVVCDRGSERSRMQIFTKNGQFIKKIAIRYIDIVAGLAITAQGMHTNLGFYFIESCMHSVEFYRRFFDTCSAYHFGKMGRCINMLARHLIFKTHNNRQHFCF